MKVGAKIRLSPSKTLKGRCRETKIVVWEIEEKSKLRAINAWQYNRLQNEQCFEIVSVESIDSDCRMLDA